MKEEKELTPVQKDEIARLLVLEKEKLGSWDRVANKVAASEATVSHNMQDPAKWDRVSHTMWAKVAGKLGYTLTDTAWKFVSTTNTEVMFELLDRAQNEQLFMAVSHPAGQGKSAGTQLYRLAKKGVFYIECKESWSHKMFVIKMAETLGIKVDRMSVAVLTDLIVGYLKEQAIKTRPLLIVDEANKLNPASLRLFIPLFNELQDEIGLVLIGAHDLERRIKEGVRRDARGFDELESRLGRTYYRLVGVFEHDVTAICAANGVTDPAAQKRCWNRLHPERKSINGTYHLVSTMDLRVLKQAIKHERLRAKNQAYKSAQLEVVGGG
ncbi:ATP-binding protein [Spirosoma aerolatum]|uniref:ATP-binding protein n=1 Tax=Spirosoma aerolatum TaxID=1211326 RepID=UPI0009ABAF30|nr:ATP-binding protein [Spirosoma aerolatum]